METMQEGGGRLQNGSTVEKTPTRLKLVDSENENGKMMRERTMDPYREFELYLAKVKVSPWFIYFDLFNHV